ncbi:MAG: hypothetical protein US89_C0006G0062 [Candidatus Peregrinibacteria bacterium GW2011_GWF2_38_29]|nr:MAG: hypothetical protein US89_C0006G0062 [Candidatus Peregrinibacteria bacterium GW2011_GWF2_38_29]
MWYLYLDESGDLGFDFVNKKPSRFFTISILALSSQSANKQLINAVKKTLKRKLNRKKNKKRFIHELKGSSTALEVKKYFYDQVKNIKFGIYSITLNKKRVFEQLTKEKDRVYNFIAKQVLDAIPFEKADETRIELIVDKSKGKMGARGFNEYIKKQLGARINPKTPLDIYHWDSQNTHGLQASDLFCWGIFQKYERRKEDWYKIYKDKTNFESLYLA